MIVGSGLIASSFSHLFSKCDDVCIYAAGVSNSSCCDTHEFERERARIEEALEQSMPVEAFVYFGTCSVSDPEARNTPYVQHKLAMEKHGILARERVLPAMEKLVQTHPRNLILRFTMVAGYTPNPHTLLNYLYARIVRSESFTLWSKAKRNIIDVNDMAAITRQLIKDSSVRNVTLNVASTTNYPIVDIVKAMERLVGKHAVYEVVERGSEYSIDVSAITSVLETVGVKFGDDYLDRVIHRYYENTT